MFETEISYIREKWFFLFTFIMLTVGFVYFNLFASPFVEQGLFMEDLINEAYHIIFNFTYQYQGATDLGKSLFGDIVPNFIAYIMLFWYLMNGLVLFIGD